MAHAIIEYTANLESQIDLDELVEIIHDACITSGVFPIQGMRTRTARRDKYKIADGNKDASFIHLLLKMGPGRNKKIMKKVMEDIFDVLINYVKPLYNNAPVALSIEIFELPETLRINKHNLNQYVVIANNKEESRA